MAVTTNFPPQPPPVAPTLSAEVGDPARPPVVPEESPEDGINASYWEQCLADAERAEKDWRTRGREIVRIYRNDGYYTPQGKKKLNNDINFNILYANTEVMLPNIYSTPPTPVVRSRFIKHSEPAPPPIPTPMGPMQPPPPPSVGDQPMGGAGGPPGGQQPNTPSTQPQPGGPPQPMPPMMGPGAPPMSGMPPPSGPPGMGGPPPPMPNGPVLGDNIGGIAEAAPPDIHMRITTEDTTPPQAPEPPPPEKPTPPMPEPISGALQPAPSPGGMPDPKDIETAASVMEKALAIIVDDDTSHEAIKAAVKDLLLPGRGLVRVRWHPVMKENPAPPDTIMSGPGIPEPEPQMIKVWETVSDEYVYWEDVLIDPVRQFADTGWVAFRHLFTEKQLLAEFPDSQQLQDLQAKKKMSDVIKWTEESAAKDTVGGGGAMKTSDKLGNVIKKAMVWEIWDANARQIIWFIREISGIVLRVDPDSLGLSGFFPIPRPLLAVTTTDSQLPRPYYDLYKQLATDLDETSRRISRLTEKIKVRGGYNSANRDVANMLLADDGKMIPIDGIDMLNGGLQNHIWLVPILEWVNALKELYAAREQIKGTIYEVMGISDILRGNSNPYETATAQRIKGTMGTNRLDGQRLVCANFALELLKMKAEIVAQNFDAVTLTRMTGEEVTPAVEAILRDDFQRTCSIDIETDSTVSIDEQTEQEGNAKILMALQGILQGMQGLLMTGVLPPPMVMQFGLELMKMMIQPIRNSRGVVELIDDFQEQLSAMAMQPPPPPGMGGPPPPGGPPLPGGPPGAGPPGPPRLPLPGGGPPGAGANAPLPPQGGPPAFKPPNRLN
jgi:hypothetical protein